MNKRKLVRFILITVPPLEVAVELEAVREELNRLAGSCAALNYPPHVTLRTGFLVPEEEIPNFLYEFRRCFDGEKAFHIRTDGIYCGLYEQDNGSQYIVCYRIKKEEGLLRLNKTLLSYRKYRKSDRTLFDPHLTIAYEDLSFEGFERLRHDIENRPELRRRQFSWKCDNAGLYLKNGDRWELYRIFSLSE
jgi:2'-5' RNA ligase